jgi:hypothetical protein
MPDERLRGKRGGCARVAGVEKTKEWGAVATVPVLNLAHGGGGGLMG